MARYERRILETLDIHQRRSHTRPVYGPTAEWLEAHAGVDIDVLGWQRLQTSRIAVVLNKDTGNVGRRAVILSAPSFLFLAVRSSPTGWLLLLLLAAWHPVYRGICCCCE